MLQSRLNNFALVSIDFFF